MCASQCPLRGIACLIAPATRDRASQCPLRGTGRLLGRYAPTFFKERKTLLMVVFATWIRVSDSIAVPCRCNCVECTKDTARTMVQPYIVLG